MIKQPKALYLLNFVSMWECFSYYGMRVLLVLFMTQKLGFSDMQAFALYALYTTLVELGGIIGGTIADRFLGLKRAINIGGWTIALGHLCLALPGEESSLYLGLGLIIAGTSFFRSNVAAFIGDFYEEKDPRRDVGYTIYYTGINIGGFLATVATGIVAEIYGWHAGFSLAGIGMVAGNIALTMGKKLLLNPTREQKLPGFTATTVSSIGLLAVGVVAAVVLSHSHMVLPWMPLVAVGFIIYILTKLKLREFKKLFFFVACMVVFYACEEQLGSSLVLFAERHVQRETLFGVIPSASLVMFNPLTILLAGSLLSRKCPFSQLGKVQGSFLLLGAAFCLLYASCLFTGDGCLVPVAYAIAATILISLGEILIGPTVYAVASESATRSLNGLVMSVVTFGYSLANLCSGYVSQLMATTEEGDIAVYANGFGLVGAAVLLIGLAFQLRHRIKIYG
ncbi:MAG: peptide MFS transporter [Verrucomicrobia bacterium]|nr:peptide MFS transporter [Verrucomicrobiota bacterium]